MLVIHGLLHIPDDIRFCGPMCHTWSFYLERYFGFLKQGLRSCSQSWRNLDERVKHFAYISQLQAKYDLHDELPTVSKYDISQSEKIYQECECLICSKQYYIENNYLDPLSILRTPHYPSYKPNEDLRNKLAVYINTLIGRQVQRISRKLPQIFPAWGAVRVKDGGDTIRSAMTRGGRRQERNATFIRVCFYFINWLLIIH